MDLFQAIGKRRSVRSFKSGEVPEEDVIKILEAGIKAPSAGNIQPWAFVVTRDLKSKALLSEAALGQGSVRGASVVITVCVKEEEAAARYGDRGRKLYCIQDTAAVVENILLALVAMGYGACWIGAFNEEAVRAALKVPSDARPVAMIPIGVPANEPSPMTRKPLSSVCYREIYGAKF
jgi:nitroreductase